MIDFDYYVDVDERAIREHPAERERLTERDRKLYLEGIRDGAPQTAPEHSPGHRAFVLRQWLAQRRGAEEPALRSLLPGASFARAQRLVTVGLGLIGCVAGAGVASALLHYDGTHPVNVSWYLFVLVLLQVLLAAATITAWGLRRSKPVQTAMADLSLVSRLIRPLLARATSWIQRQRLAHVSADVRDRAKAKTGLLQSHYALYGVASYLPILIAAQAFGIGFNIGAIASTVALEWFSDLAFGWGSALDVHPQTIFDLSRIIALPWSWAFGEGLGYPTLDQVAGSRISLKDALSTLAAGDLRAWRWFLVLGVFTYGLLPRLGLLGLSLLSQARTLSALPFTHQRTQALYARMVTPNLASAVATSGTGPQMPIPQLLEPLTAPTAVSRTATVPESAPGASPGQEPSPPKRTPAQSPAQSPAESPAVPKGAPGATGEPRETRIDRGAPGARGTDTDAPSAPATDRPGTADAPAPLSEPASAPLPARADRTEVRPSPPLAATGKAAPLPHTAIAADACVLMIHLDVADLLEGPDQIRLQRMLLAHTGWRVAASVTIGGGSAMADQALALVRSGQWEAPPPRIAIIQDGSQPPITEHLRFLRAVRAQSGAQAQILLALVGDPEGEDPLPPVSDFDYTDWQRKIEQMGDPYLRLEMLAPPATEASR